MKGIKHAFGKHSSKKETEPDWKGEYAVAEEIGRGGFAVVHRAMKKGKDEGYEVAVRICPIKLALTSHAPYVMTVETLRTKMDSAKRMTGEGKGSRYCLKFLDYRITKDDLITMSELCTGGDLFDRICNNTLPEGYFAEDDARNASRNLCQVISDVHEKGVIHRDVKPENILYTSKDSPIEEIRLTDFGCCLPYCKRGELYEGGPVGSPGYLAPEMIANKPYNMLVDEWSIGITIYEMLTGRSPLISSTPEELNRETLDRAIPYPARYWKRHSPQAKDFVQRLLQKDPKLRMSVEEALEHPWLKMENGQGQPLAHREDSTESDGPDPTETLVGRKTKRTDAPYTFMGHLTGHGPAAGLMGSDHFDATSILEGRVSQNHASRLQAMEERDSGYGSMTSSEADASKTSSTATDSTQASSTMDESK